MWKLESTLTVEGKKCLERCGDKPRKASTVTVVRSWHGVSTHEMVIKVIVETIPRNGAIAGSQTDRQATREKVPRAANT